MLKIALLHVLALSASIQAAEDSKTLRDCYEAALKRSELIAQDQEVIRQAEETYHQAIAAVLPQISGQYIRQGQQPATGAAASISPTLQNTVHFYGVQPLFQGFKEYAGLRQGQRLIDASVNDKKQAQAQLYLDTSTAYYTILANERDLQNLKTEIGLYRDRIRDLKEFERIGRSRPTDVLTMEAQKSLMDATVEQVKGLIYANRQALAFQTGFDPDIPLKDIHSAPPTARDVKEYLARLDDRPDVKGDTERYRASTEGVPIAAAGHWPTIALQGDYYVERPGSYSSVHLDYILTITLPIFSGGLIQSQVRQARSKRDQAEYQVSRTKRLAVQQINTFYVNYTYDKSQYETYKDAVRISEKNFEAQTRDYKRGLVTNLDVLTALVTFQEAQRSHDKSRFAMELDYESVEAASVMRTPQELFGSIPQSDPAASITITD